MREREDFGAVGEGDGALAGRVEGCEEVDEEGDKAEVRGGALGDVEAEAGGEERPGHVREGEEEEGAAAEGVDCEEGGPGEDEVDETEAERGDEGFRGGGAGFGEDGGGVEGLGGELDLWGGEESGGTYDDVDAAHLLGDHDCEGGESGSSDSRDLEQFHETLDVCCVTNHILLDLNLCIDVIEISRRHQLVVSELLQGLVGLRKFPLLDVPSRRFWATIDADCQRNCWKKGGTDLQSPCDLARIFDRKVGAEAEEDPEGCPHLPTHDKSASDSC